MAELVRCATGITMQEAGELIEVISAPVGLLVEEIDGVRLIHTIVPLKGELLILLHSYYPSRVAVRDILSSLGTRNPGSVRNKLRDLVGDKIIYGDPKGGYRLTQAGHAAAIQEIQEAMERRAAA